MNIKISTKPTGVTSHLSQVGRAQPSNALGGRRRLLLTVATVAGVTAFLLASRSSLVANALGIAPGKVDDGGGRRIDMSRVRGASAFTWETRRSSEERPQHHLWVFSNPACKHCMQLEQSLNESFDLVVHTVLVPSRSAMGAAVAVWCAQNQADAWQKYVQGTLDVSAAACENPLEANNALATELALEYTPAVINAFGSLRYGNMDSVSLQRHAIG